MTEDRAIRSICVAGGGIVGLSAAIAFARALPGTAVTVVETPADPAAIADHLPTALPGAERFHSAIGLDEGELVRGGIASHRLGTIFEGWPTGEWAHGYGPYGKPVGAIPFDSIWVRARDAGKALPYDRYAMAAALARAGKFVHPSSDANSASSRFSYSLRLDPDGYRERLRQQALGAGVAFEPGPIDDIERRGDDGIAALIAAGKRIEADLFVDCTGPAAQLLSALDDSFEDWSAWMPFGRMALATKPGPDAPQPVDHVVASASGWTAEWPLRGRTLKVAMSNGDGVAISRGRRLRPWVRNVLALGDAASSADPLHGMNLDLAHNAILLALELLPKRDFDPLETGEYNRRAEQVTRRVRDFLALHYVRSGRVDGVWQKAAQAEPPDSLARTLDQYEYRGRLPFHEEESVTRDSWTAALLGLGVVPKNVDPQALSVPLDQAIPAMERLVEEIDALVAPLPGYGDYLARITR